jgi:hypothetical protein
MKEVVIGRCKLCLKGGVQLLESHLMPAGMFRRLRSDEESPHPTLMTPRGSRSSSDQIRDNVFCGECEQRLHKNGEDYVLRMAATKDGFRLLETLLPTTSNSGKEWLRSTHTDSPGVRRDHLAYFGLSVFWRAAVHHWPGADRPGRTVKIELGEKNTEILRRFLMGEGVVPATMNLMLFVLTDKLSQGVIYLPSQSSKQNFRWGYGFVACGYMFNLLLGKAVDPVASRVCLIHSAEQFIWVRDGELKTLEAVRHIFHQQPGTSGHR